MLTAMGEPGIELAGFALAANSTVEIAAQALAEALGNERLPSAASSSRRPPASTRWPLRWPPWPSREPQRRSSMRPLPPRGSRDLKNDPEAALQAAEEAWNAAQRAVAESADALAEAADADGDGMTAVEARRQAARSRLHADAARPAGGRPGRPG